MIDTFTVGNVFSPEPKDWKAPFLALNCQDLLMTVTARLAPDAHVGTNNETVQQIYDGRGRWADGKAVVIEVNPGWIVAVTCRQGKLMMICQFQMQSQDH